MSGDFDRSKSPIRSRSRSRSPHRSSRNNFNNNNGGQRFDDRRTNRYRSNNYQNNDYRGSTNDPVNLYSDRELGLKYRWEKTVHVTNLPFDMRWAALKDLFRDEVGDVMYAEVFERDGRSLGCGSVEFRTIDEAKRAVEKMHQFEYGGRKMNVKMDDEGFRTRRAKYQSMEGRLSQKGPLLHSHHDARQDQFNNNPMGNTTGMSRPHQVAGLNSIGTSLSGYSSVNGIPSYILQQLGIEGPITNKVFVANLDFKCDEKKIRDVFSLAGRIREVTLKRNKDGQSRGMAVIEYEHPLEAVQAVSMFNEQQLYDRIMAVKIDLKDDGNDDGRSMKLPSGLKSIGAGLGLAGNPLRTTNVQTHEPTMPSINPNPIQPIASNASDNYMNHADLTALQALSQLTPTAIAALTQLAASGFSGLNSLSGLQSNNTGLNPNSLGMDPYSNANSLYSALSGGFGNYSQASALNNAAQLSSQLAGRSRVRFVSVVGSIVDGF